MAHIALPLDTFTTFGDLLKHLRKRAGLTQRELGNAVNYSESYITRLENNSRLPDPAAVRALFVDALHLQGEPIAAQRLIQLAESASAQANTDPTETLASTAERANNLPAPLTNFIGREREMAEVLRLLGTTRLLTLTGSGGVGKSRLALQAVSAALAHYPDGVWLVELAPVSDAALVAGTAASVFGLHTAAAAQPAKDMLIEHLRNKHALLVLDNCEHLIQACAELASALLRACPHLSILATSRESLNVQGETAWRVPSMAVAEAVQLFEVRALTAIPESALTDKDASIIAKICERLDGIPLAIELAASRLRVYSLDMIAARLDDRFRLLTGGERTALPRHQTLRALIDWSHSLLSPDEQRLLRYLSVFAGGWTLEAAEAVGEGMDVLSVLPQLVNKSLVVVGERAGQRRYTMLETIRQFAAEKLNELGEIDRAHECMATHLVTVGQALGRRAHNWLKLEAEMDNVRAAMIWARAQPDPNASLRMAVALVMKHRWDYLSEPLTWLNDALARGVHGPAELRLEAAVERLGILYFSGYSLAHRSSLIEECLSLATEVKNDVQTIEALFWCGLAAWQQQDYDRVASLNGQGLKLAQSLPIYEEAQPILNALWTLGLVEMKRGDQDAASAKFLECLRISREWDNGKATFLGLNGFGWMDPRRALRASEEEIAWLRAQGREESLARAIQAYSQPLIIEGRYSQAEDALQECLAYWHKTGVRWDASLGSAQALLDLGQLAWLQDDALLAREWYEQSFDEYSEVGDRERVARLHTYIGLTRLAQGDLEHAAKDFQIGLNLYRELEQPAGVALALTAYARLAEARGQMEIAARLFGAASASQELTSVSILWPASPVVYLHEIAEARERFAETDWMQHWHEGERMTHEQAIALALQAHSGSTDLKRISG